jgi:hypothetical protein
LSDISDIAETGDPPDGGGGAGAGGTGTGAVETTPVPTVIVLLADRVPIFTVTVAIPLRTPVTTPVADTFAIVVSLDVKTICVASVAVRSTPVADLTLPLSVRVDPTARVAVAGVIVMLLGEMDDPTVIVLLLDRVPICAVMIAIPFRMPVTTPALDTFAIVVSLDVRTT